MAAYYNENDPRAAAWLRELIRGGYIAPGDVDERSILEVRPHEIAGYTQQHFFAGIGGWSLAFRLAGWPDNRPVRSGSCPCQPFSNAGNQEGEADERHLWPVFRDFITFGDSTITFGEQVASRLGRVWLAGVRADLEGLGYAFGAADLCAAGVGAPHIRQRLFWVADAIGKRLNARGGVGGSSRSARKANRGRLGDKPESVCGPSGVAHTTNDRRAEHEPESRQWRGAEPGDAAERGSARGMGHADSAGLGEQGGPIAVSAEQSAAQLRGNADSFDILPCRDGKSRRIESGTSPLAHGISGRVELLRGYGNAIVPEVAAEFIRAVQEAIGGHRQ